MKRRLSVKSRVTLWYTALVAVLLTAALFGIIASSDKVMYERSRVSLITAVTEAAEDLELEDGYLDLDDVEFYNGGTTIYLYDSSGSLMAPLAGGGTDALERVGANTPFQSGTLQNISVKNDRWLIYDIYASVEGAHVWVRGITPMAGASGAVNAMLVAALIAVPFLILIAALGGWLITNRALKPITRMIEEAESISDGNDLSKRLETDDAKDEVAALAKNFNRMFDRLQRAFEKEKQFTSDVSHELRTPVSIIITQCEYALEKERTGEDIDESLNVILRQAKKMSGLISQLLMLIRSDRESGNDSKNRLDWEPVNFSELCQMTIEEMKLSPSLNEKGITIQAEIEPDLILTADQTLLMRLLTNLISNAIKYNKPGGSIHVSLQRRQRIVLKVKDTGIGIPEEDLEKIWDRLYRGDSSRSSKDGSAGLGLSMVKWIAQLHGGSVSVESTPGVGSTFTIIF